MSKIQTHLELQAQIESLKPKNLEIPSQKEMKKELEDYNQALHNYFLEKELETRKN